MGNINVSPKFVNKAAKCHEMNYQEYHAVDNNCQNWVIILLDEVDPSKSLSKSLEENDILPIKERGFFERVSIGSKSKIGNRKDGFC